MSNHTTRPGLIQGFTVYALEHDGLAKGVEMKSQPMIFNGAMVRALLDGSKTQTRRIMEPQPHFPVMVAGDPLTQRFDLGDSGSVTINTLVRMCPYGQPGDRLWLRETFQDADGKLRHGWRPSIHMQSWDSRIMLEIVSVRVERLTDISEADARAEGIADGGCTNCGEPEPCNCAHPQPDARDAFIFLWESINGAASWLANPWVWVIEFKRIKNEH